MKLLFIYGPPAAGKLTVANEISKIKPEFKVFHNHTLVGSVASVFGYDDPSLKKSRNMLARRFRIEIFEEAVKKNLNLITTYGGSGKDKFDFFKETLDSIEKLGGEVFFVQLCPTKEAILDRVESESRRGQKIDSKDFLLSKLSSENSYYDKFPGIDHLSIDNSNMPPIETAQRIIDYYQL